MSAPQVLALTERNMLRMARNPASLAGAIISPAVFFLGFFVVMRKILATQGIDYEQFLPPAIVVQAMIFVAMSSAYYAVDDASRGMADRLRAMPVGGGVAIAARSAADSVRGIVSLVVVTALGFAIGFRFLAGPLPALGFIAIGIAFGVALALVFGALALSAKSPEAAVQGLAMPYIFLFMLSTAFVPAERFPGWLEPIVRNQPVSQVIAALRALSSGGPTSAVVFSAIAWVVGLSVIGTIGIMRATRRQR